MMEGRTQAVVHTSLPPQAHACSPFLPSFLPSSDLVLKQGRSGHAGTLVWACARGAVPHRARVEIGSADWKC